MVAGERGPEPRSLGPEPILLHLEVEISVQAVPAFKSRSFYEILKPNSVRTHSLERKLSWKIFLNKKKQNKNELGHKK